MDRLLCKPYMFSFFFCHRKHCQIRLSQVTSFWTTGEYYVLFSFLIVRVTLGITFVFNDTCDDLINMGNLTYGNEDQFRVLLLCFPVPERVTFPVWPTVHTIYYSVLTDFLMSNLFDQSIYCFSIAIMTFHFHDFN